MRLDEKKKKDDALALRVYEEINTSPTSRQSIGDVLTKSEKITVGRRLLIAQAILNGKTRRDVQHELGVSPNTFAQVNRWLENEFTQYSAFTVTSKISTSYKLRKRSRYVQPFSYEHLKRSYPAHFALFTIAETIWKQAQK